MSCPSIIVRKARGVRRDSVKRIAGERVPRAFFCASKRRSTLTSVLVCSLYLFKRSLTMFRTRTSAFRTSIEAFRTRTSAFRTSIETFRTRSSAFRTSIEAFRTRSSAFRTSIEAFRTRSSAFRTSIEAFRTGSSTFGSSTETFRRCPEITQGYKKEEKGPQIKKRFVSNNLR
jgi:septal ring factor EnvC (AmiA/AmiB activator)